MFRKYCLSLLVLLTAALLVLAPDLASAGSYGDFQYTLNDSTKEIVITGYTGSAADLVIPATINGYYVTKIGQDAFANKASIVNLSFESGSRLTSLGIYAFKQCTNLQTVSFPSTLNFMDIGCFEGCTSLLSVEIPEGFTLINTNNTSAGVFRDCTSLRSVTLPSTLQRIGGCTFCGCTSLQQITLPAGLTGIGANCFYGSGLTEIDIPAGVTYIDYECFTGCTSLKTVRMSENVKEFGISAFNGCTSLTSINIPLDLETLRGGCLAHCSSLPTLRFGDAVRDIRSEVFAGSTNLTVEVVRGSLMETYCMNNDVPFIVYATSLGGCTVDGIQDKTYTGEPIRQDLDIRWGEDRLTEETDYTTRYEFNVNVGTAKIIITGIGNYIGTIEKSFQILAEDISKCTVTLAKKELVYNAKYQTPAVTVKFNGITVSSGEYKVSYANNCYVGIAKVTVSGTGNFINSKEAEFRIVPKAVKIKSVKKGTKSFTVQWSTNKIQTTGYILQYSTSKDFKKAKKMIISNNTTNKMEIKKLASGKTYYVRICAFRKVGSENICSAWSNVKKVKVK